VKTCPDGTRTRRGNSARVYRIKANNGNLIITASVAA
jgi:hypothetical protein